MSTTVTKTQRQYQKRDLKHSVSSVSSCYSDGASRLKAGLEQRGIKGIDEALIQDMVGDNISMGLIEDELENFADDYDLQVVTRRQKLLHFLRSHPVSIFLMVLVIVDIFVIIGMTIINLYIGDEKVKEWDKEGLTLIEYGNNVCPNFATFNVSKLEYASKAIFKYEKGIFGGYPEDTAANGGNPFGTSRSGSANDNTGWRAKRAPEDTEAYMQSNRYFTIKEVLESFHNGLHLLSIIILGVFVFELALKLIAMGMRFFKRKTEILDGTIIIVSFVMDVVLTDSTTTHTLGKFILIVFLLGRIVKIANVMMMKTRLRTLFRTRLLKKARRYTHILSSHLEQDLVDLRLELKQLQELNKKYKVPAAEYMPDPDAFSQTGIYGKKPSKLRKTFSSVLSLNKSPSTNSFQASTAYRQKAGLSQSSSINSFSDIRGGKKPLKRNSSEAGFKVVQHPQALSHTKQRSNSSIELGGLEFEVRA